MPRFLIDLQSCQTEGSRNRGIGRYSQSLALTLARLGRNSHDLHFSFNAAYAEAALDLRQRLNGLARQDRLIEYGYPQTAGPWPTGQLDARRAVASLGIESAWLACQPDLIHISSIFEGLGGAAVVPALDSIPRSAIVSATAYDLIPLLFEERYLAAPDVRDWYFNCLNTLRRCDLVLAISEATRRDLIDHLDFSEHKVVNISGAADAAFFPATVSPDRKADLARRLGLERPFVMYTGGIDHRKNLDALIGAYARIPGNIRSRHQLAIVCNASREQQDVLYRTGRERGLADGELVITGFVEDEDLVDLYRTCACFVFPSLYEGFGLPLLEAMACGAPCIAADNSSLPEIIGDRSLCFDASSEDAIAAMLSRMLTDGNWRRHATEHGLSRAALFSWDRTARRAMEAFEAALLARRCDAPAAKPRPRLAYLSPLPPEQSGIANFSEELLPYLKEHFDIDLYLTQEVDPLPWIRRGYGAHPWQRLPAKYEHYEGRVFYQMGNSQFHVHLVALLARYPGIALIHDAFLSGLSHLIEVYGAGSPLPGFFAEQIEHSEGARGTELLRTRGAEVAVKSLPVNRWIVELCSGVVCTSDHARTVLDPPESPCPVPIRIVPHLRGVRTRSPSIRRSAREALGLEQDQLVVCSFGFIAEPKATVECIEAWALSETSRSGARLILVGEKAGDYGARVQAVIADRGVGESISITGYAEDESFRHYLDACDIAIQLRTRSHGEVSGAVLHNFARGTPVILNDVGAMSEFAPEGALHLPPAFAPAQLASALDRLAADPSWRGQLGERGRQWLASNCDPARAAQAMAEFIVGAAASSRRARLARLSGAIASVLLAVPREARASLLDFDRKIVADFEAEERRLDHRPQFASFVADTLAAVSSGDPSRVSGAWSSPAPARDEATAIRLDVSSPLVLTEVGQRTQDGLLVSAGRPGILMYGPYLPLAGGKYVVRLYGKWLGESPAGAATMDVVADGGGRKLGEGGIACIAGATDVASLLEIPIFLESRTSTIEVRVHVTCDASIGLGKFEIMPVA